VIVDDDSTIADEVAHSEVKPAQRRLARAFRPRLLRCLARWRPMMLTTLLIAATGVAAGLYYFEYRPDRETNSAAADEVIRAASDGAVVLLSYSPESLSRDVRASQSIFRPTTSGSPNESWYRRPRGRRLRRPLVWFGPLSQSYIRIQPLCWCLSVRKPRARKNPSR
jgi:hypothetical protein